MKGIPPIKTRSEDKWSRPVGPLFPAGVGLFFAADEYIAHLQICQRVALLPLVVEVTNVSLSLADILQGRICSENSHPSVC